MTDEERKYIVECWRSYDTAMGDPWRNDFEDDPLTADLWRYQFYIIDEVKSKFPHISDEQIEEVIDTLS